ncbi:MAG: AAA family ATPase, partial [Clostridia bacterium]|nr:AAA family ATPase [Clostridia bacterium]
MPKYSMPVGNTNFREIRETGLYYVDKSMLIDQIVEQSKAKVTLFTRPRRFGKTLNMSMLQHFFDIREDSKALFEGLAITEKKELCDNWMN